MIVAAVPPTAEEAQAAVDAARAAHEAAGDVVDRARASVVAAARVFLRETGDRWAEEKSLSEAVGRVGAAEVEWLRTGVDLAKAMHRRTRATGLCSTCGSRRPWGSRCSCGDPCTCEACS